MKEALAHLHKGLDLAAALPEDAARWRLELGLKTGLGQAHIGTKGFGVPEVGESFGRARALCERLGNPPELLPVANGQVQVHTSRGELDKAGPLAEELRQLGRLRNDPAMETIGCYASGRVSFSPASSKMDA